MVLWAFTLLFARLAVSVMDWGMGDAVCRPWGSLASSFLLVNHTGAEHKADHRAPRLSNWLTHMQKQHLYLWTANVLNIKYRMRLFNIISNIFQILNPFFFLIYFPWITTLYSRSICNKFSFILTLLEGKPHTPQKSKILLSHFSQYYHKI